VAGIWCPYAGTAAFWCPLPEKFATSKHVLSFQERCLCGESRLSAAVTRRTAEKAEMTKLFTPVVVNVCFADCS